MKDEPIWKCRGTMTDNTACPLTVFPLGYVAGPTLVTEVVGVRSIRDQEGQVDTEQQQADKAAQPQVGKKKWEGLGEFHLTCDNGHTFDYYMDERVSGTVTAAASESEVNKAYWRKQGYELVEGAHQRIIGHMSTLGTYVDALLSAYTLNTLFETYFMQLDSVWYAIALVVPFAVVSYAKFKILTAPVPDQLSELQPESWESCRAVKQESLSNAMERLTHVKWWTHISAVLMIFVSVAVAALAQDKKKDDDTEKAASKELPKMVAKADSLSKVISDFYMKSQYRGGMTYLKKYERLELNGLFPPSVHVDVQVNGKISKRDTVLLKAGRTVGVDGRFENAWEKIVKADSMMVRFTFATPDKAQRTVEEAVILKDR